MQQIYKPVDVACAFAVPRIPAVDWLVFLSWFLQNSENNENISELVSLQGSVIQRSSGCKLIKLLRDEAIIRLRYCCKFHNTPGIVRKCFWPAIKCCFHTQHYKSNEYEQQVNQQNWYKYIFYFLFIHTMSPTSQFPLQDSSLCECM